MLCRVPHCGSRFGRATDIFVEVATSAAETILSESSGQLIHVATKVCAGSRDRRHSPSCSDFVTKRIYGPHLKECVIDKSLEIGPHSRIAPARPVDTSDLNRQARPDMLPFQGYISFTRARVRSRFVWLL